MKSTIDTTTLPGFLRVRNEGKMTIESFTKVWDDILASDFWRRGLCVLFDHRKIERLPRDGSGAQMTSAAVNLIDIRSRQIGNSRIAILLDTRENLVYARLLQYGVTTRDLPVNVGIFVKEQDAVQWLSAKRAPRPVSESLSVATV